MKYLVFLFAVSLSAQTVVSTGNHRKLFPSLPFGWSHAKIITVDHTKVGSTDQTNLPVLISGTYSYLATVANGGNVTSGSGYDIGFYADSGLTTKLNWEVESWSATTGTVIYWVQIPTVSHTTDTVIYMAYDNSGITTDQSNGTGTWDTNFKMVWHLPNGTTLTANDSTSNGHNGTNLDPLFIFPATGLMDGGSICTAAGTCTTLSHDNLHNSISTLATGLSGFTNITFSVWFKTTNNLQCVGTGGTMYSKHNGGTNGEWFMCPGGNGSAANNKIDCSIINASSSRVDNTVTLAAGTYNDGNWHNLTCVYNGSTITDYFDGAAVGSAASQTGIIKSTSYYVHLFAADVSTNGPLFPGSLDEARISNSARSADWVLANYNNQISPSTFYAVTTLF